MLKLLGFVAGMTLSATIFAVGMGGINVTSGLGQLLKADIELVAVNKAEKVSLIARLASPEVYKGAGLDYPYGNKFKFQIESRANGEPYIKVSSAQPINDPFVVMLVELTWSSGKLLREYTFLLDPPGYVAELPAQAAVQPVAPAVQSAAPAAAAMPVEPVAPPEVLGSVEQGGPPAASAPASISEPAEQAPVAAAEPVLESIAAGGIPVPNEEWLAVQRGDTLTKLSAQYKTADVSLERMLVALYRANASEFDGKNMNRIRAGKILRLPSQKEVDGVAQSDAVKEIRAQVADWNAYRQKLAGAASISSQAQEAEQMSTGKLASSVADKAPVAKESAKEVLKLSKGEVPGDQAATGAGGKTMTAQDKKNAAREDAIAKTNAVKEERVRTAMLEKNLQDMQRLAQLKSEAAALAQQPPVAAAPPAATSAVAAASQVKPAPVAKPKAPVKQEPSLVDQILDEPLYLIAGAGVLVVLGGLGWLVSRRKKKPSFEVISKFTEDVGSRSGRIAAPAMSSPETGDFTGMVATKAEAGEQSNEADPISEADLFLNFGRDAQAEEILKDALQSTPNDHRIHLKLLEVYANRKDLSAFATIVRQLQDSGDEEASQKALAMGRELDPKNPMYGGSGAKETVGSATMQAPVFDAMPRLVPGDTSTAKAASVDFDLGAPSAKSAASPEQDFLTDEGDEGPTVVMLSGATAGKPADVMDFDVTSTHPPIPAVGEQAKSAMPDLGDLIFDVTGSRPTPPADGEETEVPLPKLDGMTFDVTGSHPTMPAEQPEDAKAAQADDSMMEFTLDFPVESKPEKSAPAAQSAEVGLAGISLNFDDAAAPAAAPASEIKDEHWQEVATKLDLAKAYQEMGDASGAREILDEVMREGDAGQREVAQSLLAQLG